MKNYKIYTYDVPLVDGGRRRGMLLEADGGVGEIAPLPGWSAETFEEALSSLTSFCRDRVIRTHFPPSVLFGIDGAMNPLTEDIDFSYRSLLYKEGQEAMTREVKVKVGHMPVERAIRFVKECLERGLLLSIDVNRLWEMEETVAFCKAFKPSDFLYIEDPVPHFSRLETFYEKSGFSYAVDEFVPSHPLPRILSLQGLSHIVIKPMLIGGQKEVGDLIQAIPKSISYSLTSSLETAVGCRHIIRLHHLFKTTTPLGIDTLSMHAESIVLSPLQIEEKTLSKTLELDYTKLVPYPAYR